MTEARTLSVFCKMKLCSRLRYCNIARYVGKKLQARDVELFAVKNAEQGAIP